MSLSAIQDNLLKTSLVQQTQTKGDDVIRGHENAAAAVQKEQGRQQDQVVLSTQGTEGRHIRDDEEKKRDREEKEKEEEENSRREKKKDSNEEDQGPRARMRTINVVI